MVAADNYLMIAKRRSEEVVHVRAAEPDLCPAQRCLAEIFLKDSLLHGVASIFKTLEDSIKSAYLWEKKLQENLKSNY